MSWLSKLWKKENDKDRCGVGFLRLPNRHPFTSACKAHDIEYLMAEAGNQLKTRKEVDKELLYNMKYIADTKYVGYKRTFFLGQAYLFYGLVVIIGGYVWDGDD